MGSEKLLVASAPMDVCPDEELAKSTEVGFRPPSGEQSPRLVRLASNKKPESAAIPSAWHPWGS
eukprot:5827146-Amphidinium_carterae.1